MLSKELFKYSLYRLFTNLYNNYLPIKYKEDKQKLLKQKLPFINNVSKIKYNYKY